MFFVQIVDNQKPSVSVRMDVKDVSARWLNASKALKKEDQIYGHIVNLKLLMSCSSHLVLAE